MQAIRLSIMSLIMATSTAQATTIIIKEINNESKASLTMLLPNGTKLRIKPLDTILEPIVVVENNQADNFETSPIIVAEGSLTLFDIQFIRKRTQSRSGRVEVTLQAVQNGKKLLAKKSQEYLYDAETYMVTLTIQPGKGQVIAEPKVAIEATYAKPELSPDDWEQI